MKGAGDYLARLWDNMASTRSATPEEKAIAKRGWITLRTSESFGYVHRQIAPEGGRERDAHVQKTARSLGVMLTGALERAEGRPLVPERGGMSLAERRAMDMGLVTKSRSSTDRDWRLTLTAFGRAALAARRSAAKTTEAQS